LATPNYGFEKRQKELAKKKKKEEKLKMKSELKSGQRPDESVADRDGNFDETQSQPIEPQTGTSAPAALT
jgi:hypothetical protein